MYEDIVRRLRKMVKAHKEIYGGSTEESVAIEKAADVIEELKRDLDFAIRAEAAAVKACTPRWIPVTERLPERFIPVIVFGDGVVGCGDFVGFAEPAHCASWDCDTSEIETVTHWMPLPEPPKEEKENDKTDM